MFFLILFICRSDNYYRQVIRFDWFPISHSHILILVCVCVFTCDCSYMFPHIHIYTYKYIYKHIPVTTVVIRLIEVCILFWSMRLMLVYYRVWWSPLLRSYALLCGRKNDVVDTQIYYILWKPTELRLYY